MIFWGTAAWCRQILIIFTQSRKKMKSHHRFWSNIVLFSLDQFLFKHVCSQRRGRKAAPAPFLLAHQAVTSGQKPTLVGSPQGLIPARQASAEWVWICGWLRDTHPAPCPLLPCSPRGPGASAQPITAFLKAGWFWYLEQYITSLPEARQHS